MSNQIRNAAVRVGMTQLRIELLDRAGADAFLIAEAKADLEKNTEAMRNLLLMAEEPILMPNVSWRNGTPTIGDMTWLVSDDNSE